MIKSMIQDRIAQVKSLLLVDQPYFGTIASYLEPTLNDDVSTFKSTPKQFEYNNEYLQTLSNKELSFVLTNSAMHQAFSHDERMQERIPWLWTLATDYAINSLLSNNGLTAPAYSNHDERFNNMCAEAIYEVLQGEVDEEKHSPEQVSQISYEQKILSDDGQDSIQDMHEQLLQKAKLYGDLPLGIEVLVPNLHEGEISWREELYDVIEQSIKFDYQLFPANKRYISQGIALPALCGTKVKLLIAIDSSRSIDDKILSQFLAEVNAIMNTFENYEIDLLVADAKVQEHHILYPGDEIDYTLKGGGGTNFANTFKYIDENILDVTLMLYFTDGLGKFPKEEPYYDTVWVLSNSKCKLPFGRTIFL